MGGGARGPVGGVRVAPSGAGTEPGRISQQRREESRDGGRVAGLQTGVARETPTRHAEARPPAQTRRRLLPPTLRSLRRCCRKLINEYLSCRSNIVPFS